jgi:hypothetical protein
MLSRTDSCCLFSLSGIETNVYNGGRAALLYAGHEIFSAIAPSSLSINN